VVQPRGSGDWLYHGCGRAPVEVIGILISLASVLVAIFSSSNKLLREIRDTLREINEKL
jgi:hypothetical protein